jgi:hypothetical protein
LPQAAETLVEQQAGGGPKSNQFKVRDADMCDKNIDMTRKAEGIECPYCSAYHKKQDKKWHNNPIVQDGWGTALPLHTKEYLIEHNKKAESTFDARIQLEGGRDKRRKLHERVLHQIRMCSCYHIHCHGQGKEQTSCLTCSELGSLMKQDPHGRQGDMICVRSCCSCLCDKVFYEKDRALIAVNLKLKAGELERPGGSFEDFMGAARGEGQRREHSNSSNSSIAKKLVHSAHDVSHLSSQVRVWGSRNQPHSPLSPLPTSHLSLPPCPLFLLRTESTSTPPSRSCASAAPLRTCSRWRAGVSSP